MPRNARRECVFRPFGSPAPGPDGKRRFWVPSCFGPVAGASPAMARFDLFGVMVVPVPSTTGEGGGEETQPVPVPREAAQPVGG